MSVLRHTIVWPTQVVTFTNAPGQFNTIGEAFTVNCAEPVTPDTVAWMATGPPVLTPVAKFPFIVAMDGFALAQVAAGAPTTVLPRASLGVALNCCMVQRGIEAVAGSTATDVTTCCTVTVSAGLGTWFEVARAVMCAVPFATAVTTPDEDTDATDVASLDQLNVAPETALPPGSNAVATSDTAWPRLASDALDAPPDVATVTLATTCATLTATEPLTPFEVALTVPLPFASAVTRPALETPATAAELLDQVKVTLDVTSPCRGFVAVADSCAVSFSFENEMGPSGVTVIVST